MQVKRNNEFFLAIFFYNDFISDNTGTFKEYSNLIFELFPLITFSRSPYNECISGESITVSHQYFITNIEKFNNKNNKSEYVPFITFLL